MNNSIKSLKMCHLKCLHLNHSLFSSSNLMRSGDYCLPLKSLLPIITSFVWLLSLEFPISLNINPMSSSIIVRLSNCSRSQIVLYCIILPCKTLICVLIYKFVISNKRDTKLYSLSNDFLDTTQYYECFI